MKLVRLSSGWFISFACLVGFTLLILALRTQGYCPSETRFVSEQEIFDSAIADELWAWRGDSDFKGYSGDLNAKGIHYESVEDFKALNPNCCSILGLKRLYRDHGFWQYLWGFVNHVVELDYVVRYRDINDNVKTFRRKQRIPVSSCARILAEPERGGDFSNE